jgi:hypothetical protein
MTELVSGMPASQLGANLRECEDQSLFKVQAVPVFRFDLFKKFSRTPGGRVTQLKLIALESVVTAPSAFY